MCLFLGLILMKCQLIYSYHIYIDIYIFLCSFIKGVFHKLYDIKYSYLIQIIYLQLYGFDYS